MLLITLLVSVLFLVSFNDGPEEWMQQDDWAQSGPVCYSTPKGWLSNPIPAGGVWNTFMKSNGGIGMLSQVDPAGAAELKIAMLQPPLNADDPEGPALGAFTASAAETLMADHTYLDAGSVVKTEVSGYPAYEIGYSGANADSDVEGRLITIAGGSALVIITYFAPAEEWEHFGPLYDRTVSNIFFATEKDADGNWEACFPWLR